MILFSSLALRTYRQIDEFHDHLTLKIKFCFVKSSLFLRLSFKSNRRNRSHFSPASACLYPNDSLSIRSVSSIFLEIPDVQQDDFSQSNRVSTILTSSLSSSFSSYFNDCVCASILLWKGANTTTDSVSLYTHFFFSMEENVQTGLIRDKNQTLSEQMNTNVHCKKSTFINLR